jgi:hypothetical protein
MLVSWLLFKLSPKKYGITDSLMLIEPWRSPWLCNKVEEAGLLIALK